MIEHLDLFGADRGQHWSLRHSRVALKTRFVAHWIHICTAAILTSQRARRTAPNQYAEARLIIAATVRIGPERCPTLGFTKRVPKAGGIVGSSARSAADNVIIRSAIAVEASRRRFQKLATNNASSSISNSWPVRSSWFCWLSSDELANGRESGNEPPVPLRDNFLIPFNRPLIGSCYPERAPALELLPVLCRCTAKEARFLPWGRASITLFA